MKLQEIIPLNEISRRDFIKGSGGAAISAFATTFAGAKNAIARSGEVSAGDSDWASTVVAMGWSMFVNNMDSTDPSTKQVFQFTTKGKYNFDEMLPHILKARKMFTKWYPGMKDHASWGIEMWFEGYRAGGGK